MIEDLIVRGILFFENVDFRFKLGFNFEVVYLERECFKLLMKMFEDYLIYYILLLRFVGGEESVEKL